MKDTVLSAYGGSANHSFVVKIRPADHSGIRGRVHWLDQNRAQEFRSYLELVHLLTDAIVQKGELADLRSWKYGDGSKPQKR